MAWITDVEDAILAELASVSGLSSITTHKGPRNVTQLEELPFAVVTVPVQVPDQLDHQAENRGTEIDLVIGVSRDGSETQADVEHDAMVAMGEAIRTQLYTDRTLGGLVRDLFVAELAFSEAVGDSKHYIGVTVVAEEIF